MAAWGGWLAKHEPRQPRRTVAVVALARKEGQRRAMSSAVSSSPATSTSYDTSYDKFCAGIAVQPRRYLSNRTIIFSHFAASMPNGWFVEVSSAHPVLIPTHSPHPFKLN